MTSLQYLWTEVNRLTLDQVASREISYLDNLFDMILFVHTKRFDCKNPIVTFLVSELPNIREPPGREWPLGELTECECNNMGSRQDPV